MLTNNEALEYFVNMMHEGKIEYRNGELWRMWELRRGWLSHPRRAEKETHGYYMLRTTDKDVGKPLYVMAHRVIWCYFYKEIPDGYQINHKNGIKRDNRIENIEAITPSGNINHAFKNGLTTPARGLESGRGKLSDEDVENIRSLLETGQYLHREIAEMYDVRQNHISRIKTGSRRSKGETDAGD